MCGRCIDELNDQNDRLRKRVRELEAQITSDRIDQGLLQGYREATDKNRQTILRLEEELRVAKAAAVAMDSVWLPPRPVPPQVGLALAEVVNEYHRAKAKHGEMTLDGATITDVLRLACLVEEVGEVAHEMTYDAGNGSLGRLYGELLQVANVAVTWASALIDREEPSQPSQPKTVVAYATTVLPGIERYQGVEGDDLRW